MRLLAWSIALVLVVAAPAAAETEVFVAYGEDNTVCTIQVSKLILNWSHPETTAMVQGHTDCNVALEQTARAWMDPSAISPGADGGVSSCFSQSCGSAEWVDGGDTWPEPVQYRLRLRAPAGQGWIGSPVNCSGIGTDNLDCTFQAHH